jgi:inner membrane protein
MDSLTHTAVGLCLARAGWRRATPGATAILVLACNAADVDIVAAAGGAATYLNHHRGVTHSVVLAPVLAWLVVLLVRVVGRTPIRWLPAYGIALAGVGVHLALDYTNVYGIRLLAPFSGEWYRADWIGVVDPVLWAVFGLAMVAPLVSRLVHAEIGAAGGESGRGWAIAALLFLLLYGGSRAVLHTRAVAVLDARMYQGLVPVRVAAFPHPGNPVAWRGLVETEEFYSLHDVNLAGEFDPTRGEVYYKSGDDAARVAARATRVFGDFLRFAQYPMWRSGPTPDEPETTLVEAFDLRFGGPTRPGFVARALVDSHHRVVRAWFTFGHAGPR